MKRWLVSVCLAASIAMSPASFAGGEITSLRFVLDAGAHFLDDSHFSIIGACVWEQWTWHGPSISATLELDEYLPDLAVSVYNEEGDDPWLYPNTFLDDMSYDGGDALLQTATGLSNADMYNGNQASTDSSEQHDAETTKYVDVLGSPGMIVHVPFATLRSATWPNEPFYQSMLDTPGRMGIAETLEPGTYNPLGGYIGTFMKHWAPEFPRTMTVDNDNDYIASTSIALHAADIVTNDNSLHVVHSASDSCGTNCAIANVIPESSDSHEIWEEVYPNDHHITLGKFNLMPGHPIGHRDIVKGHGNYVYMIWRHYKGCVQHSGSLIYKTVDVPPTHKR